MMPMMLVDICIYCCLVHMLCCASACHRKNIDINDANDARGYLYLLLLCTRGMLRPIIITTHATFFILIYQLQ